jgi:hypothetical protein
MGNTLAVCSVMVVSLQTSKKVKVIFNQIIDAELKEISLLILLSQTNMYRSHVSKL